MDGLVPTIDVHTVDAQQTSSSMSLVDDTLQADFSLEANWRGHARAFSPDNDWLAIATANHDFIVDLRTARVLSKPAEGSGATARGFSSGARYLIEQRGRSMTLLLLPLAAGGNINSGVLAGAREDAAPCETEPHLARWCGNPDVASKASARLAPHADAAAWLSGEQGLLGLAVDGDGGLVERAISSCGSNCVRQYAFSLEETIEVK
jgi:hypothetical protein